MKFNIRWKITFVFFLLVIIAVSIGTWFHIRNQIQGRTEELQSRAVAMGKVIGLKFANPLLTGTSVSEELRAQTSVWMQENEDTQFLIVYNRKGDKIFELRPGDKVEDLDLSLDDYTFSEVMSHSIQRTGRTVADDTIYDILVPIKLLHTDFGMIRLGFDITRLYEERNQIIYYNAMMGVGLLLLAGLLSLLATNWLVEPIEKLETTTSRLAGGDMSARANIQSGDEIEELGERFNDMAGKLQNRIEDLETIESLNRRISSELRPEDLHDHIVHILYETWELPNIALILHDQDTGTLETKAGINLRKPFYSSSDEDDELKSTLEQVETPYERHETDVDAPLERLFKLEDSSEVREWIVYPLNTESKELGYLLLARSDEPFEDRTLKLIQTLTYQIKIAIENTNHYTRAVTDDLTGLYTRRFYDLQLEEELRKSHDEPVSLAMIDIDDFKSYNDTYGHPAGDVVLERLAEVFENHVRTADTHEAERQPDTVARYGGEEFGIILPNTNIDSARSVTQRIVAAVADIDEFERQITISVGVAESNPGEQAQSLITRADQALYRAKSEGKNQVCLASE
jgi:diguanylate cyclase (GGDEF)-like protein